MRNVRTAAVLLLTGLTLLSLTGLATAQSSETTVTTTVSAGSRQLSVTDVAGNPLTSLALTPGVPSPFKVSVQDSDYVATRGFTVTSTLNNLYRQSGTGSYDYTTKIPAQKVSVSYATTPLSVAGTAVDLLPDYLLSSGTADGLIACDDVGGILGLSATQLLTDPICGLLNTLTGSTLSFTGVPLDATGIVDIALSTLDRSQLPVAIGGGSDAGAYTQADCSNGIGAGDTSGACTTGTGTARTYLTGTAPTDPLNSALTTLLGGKALTTPLVSDGTTAAIATTTAVIQALQASATTAVSDLGNRLTQYTSAQQISLVNGLLATVLDTIGSLDLANLTGLYHAFPKLTVAPDGVASGTYAGTLTVTLVE